VDTIPYRHSDAGRPPAWFNERKDCTVRAFALAVGVTYLDAFRELARLGRRTGRGFKFRLVAEGRPDLFTRTQLLKGKRKRVRTLLPQLTSGRYVLRINRHVFAVVDGVLFDDCGYESLKNCIVTDIYQVRDLTIPKPVALV
jgi:hypothetical protein